MTQSARAQEPSMEEILASIRRIIADDDTAKVEPPKAPPPPAPKPPISMVPPPPEPTPNVEMGQNDIDALLAGMDPEPEPAAEPADVFDLVDPVPVPPRAPIAAPVPPALDIEFREAPEPPRPIPDRVMPPRPIAAPDPAIVSERTSVAVSAAFHSLTNTILSQNARTLEDLVEDMLRPMLKHWLDENLPSIVERLVRAEIERVSRGRG